MKYCPGCGTANKAASKFCSNCGALLSAPTEARCAICGSLNSIESVYCNTCGARLNLKTMPEKPASLAPLKPPPESPIQGSAPGPAFGVRIVGLQAGTTTGLTDTAPGANYAGENEAPAGPGTRVRGSAPRKPYMPEWIARLRPTSPAERSTPTPRSTSAGEEDFAWLRELTEADAGAAEGAAERARAGEQDWLANLRAVASAGDDEAREESGPRTRVPGHAPVEEGEPLPIPKWFENIRPPSRSPRVEPSAPESPPAAAPSLALQPLPSWLIELQTLEPGRDEPAVGDSEPPASTPAAPAEARPEMPEWLTQMETAPSESPSEPRE